MPLLKIQTNVSCPEEKRNDLLKQMSASVAEMLAKPERYVMISLEINPHMLFAGENTPLAYLELKSIGLPENQTRTFAETLCTLVSDHLGVAADRVYIEFSDAARHMWGWNGATF